MWSDSLVGKRVILDNTIDDILYAVENGIDKGEILAKGQTDGDAPFWSEENGEWFWYAYVLDEDFVEEPLAKVRWFREDVRNSLARSMGREVTDADVDAVIDAVDWKALESAMVERGWDFIDMAADEYARRMQA